MSLFIVLLYYLNVLILAVYVRNLVFDAPRGAIENIVHGFICFYAVATVIPLVLGFIHGFTLPGLFVCITILSIANAMIFRIKNPFGKDFLSWMKMGPVIIVITISLIFIVISSLTPSLNYDSNTYRISRVFEWIANGSMDVFATNDARHNYMAHNYELLLFPFLVTGNPLEFMSIPQTMGYLT